MTLNRPNPSSNPDADTTKINESFSCHQITFVAKLTVPKADRKKALKGLTHLKLAPGAELRAQGADRYKAL